MFLRTHFKLLLIVTIFVGILIILLTVPLSAIKTAESNYLYVDGKPVFSNVAHVAFGNKTISSSSPLHTKQSKRVFVLPFKSYSINPATNELNLAEILKNAGVTYGDYTIVSYKFFTQSRWLVVMLGSKVPDGGVYYEIISWRSSDGQWHDLGYYDGESNPGLQNKLPSEVMSYLGMNQ